MRYGIYTEDVEFEDRFKVPNFCKIKLHKSRNEAKRRVSKEYKDRVFQITKSEYNRRCPRVEEVFK